LALQVLHDAGTQLAYGIYLLVMSYDPQLVVIGGGLASEQSPLITSIRAGVTQWRDRSPIFRSMMADDAIRVAGLQRNAGVVGAAALIAVQQRIEL
jgi:glucokinase